MADKTTSFTNHTAGPKGVNMKGGSTVWIDPGQTIEIVKADIVGVMPDLGKEGDNAPSGPDQSAVIEALRSENDALNLRIAELEKAAQSVS